MARPLFLRQRILIAEVEDGDVEREELVARDEVRIGLNHDVLEILPTSRMFFVSADVSFQTCR